MANHRTGNPSNITTQKAHPGLRQLPIILLLTPHRAINEANRLLKRRKLAHGVRNLPSPQGHNPLVQPRDTFLRDNLAPALARGRCKGREGGLHAHLDRLPGAQECVGDEFSGRAGREKHNGAVHVGEEVFAVLVLEDLVEAVFAQALEAVADEGG